ncbi:hypothetical protein ACJX0J_020325, partial [Zea mays]
MCMYLDQMYIIVLITILLVGNFSFFLRHLRQIKEQRGLVLGAQVVRDWRRQEAHLQDGRYWRAISIFTISLLLALAATASRTLAAFVLDRSYIDVCILTEDKKRLSLPKSFSLQPISRTRFFFKEISKIFIFMYARY